VIHIIDDKETQYLIQQHLKAINFNAIIGMFAVFASNKNMCCETLRY
jgi:hypothetical protein